MKVLILGTSHAGMFIDAWKIVSSQYAEDIAVDFLAVPAPWLAKELSETAAPVDGVWRYKEQGLVNYLARSGQLGDGAIDFRQYDCLVFVDMFFCYDYAHLISGSGEFGLTVDGVPASGAVWKAAIENTLGSPVYRNHPVIGNVEGIDVRSFLRAATSHGPSAGAYLIPRPMMPAQRLGLIKRNKHRAEDVVEYARWFDSVASRALTDAGISYIPRGRDSICRETGATRDDMSVGWLDAEQSKLNEHLTAEYALPLLREIIQIRDTDRYEK